MKLTFRDVAEVYGHVNGIAPRVELEQIIVHPEDWVSLVKAATPPGHEDPIGWNKDGDQTILGIPALVDPLQPPGAVDVVYRVKDRTYRIRQES